MEQKDLEIIKKHSNNDENLAKLYNEHLEYEKLLEKFNSKPFLTPSDELERKQIQKKKLIGKDKLEEIIKKYRTSETN